MKLSYVLGALMLPALIIGKQVDHTAEPATDKTEEREPVKAAMLTMQIVAINSQQSKKLKNSDDVFASYRVSTNQEHPTKKIKDSSMEETVTVVDVITDDNSTPMQYSLRHLEKEGLLTILAERRILLADGLESEFSLANDPHRYPMPINIKGDIEATITNDSVLINYEAHARSQPFGEMKSRFRLVDGGAVVISQKIMTRSVDKVQKTPIIGSVPLLGGLFQKKMVDEETVNYLYFISTELHDL